MPDDIQPEERLGLANLEPDQLMAFVANGVALAEPVLGHFATLCASMMRERRLEIEARLAARLRELAYLFDRLDELQAREVAARDAQYQALCVLIEVARLSGDPLLIAEGMRCFRSFVESTPSLTQDFVKAVKAFDGGAF